MKTSKNKRYNLDTPLIQLTEHDVWTARDACAGTCIFGTTGSGKTTGSFNNIASSFLINNFGGLWLCSKEDDIDNIIKLAAKTGRLQDLMIINPNNPLRFNFLNYQYNQQKMRHGSGAGLSENIVNLLTTMTDVGKGDKKGSGSENYWQDTLHQLLINSVDLVIYGGKNGLNLLELYKAVISAPTSPAQTADTKWQNSSLCWQLLSQGMDKKKSAEEAHDFDITATYWLNEFPNLDEKTRSIIVSSFTSMANSFLRGKLHTLFCTETNVIPEMCWLGQKILVVDLSVKEYQKLGVLANVLVKYCFQKSAEIRSLDENSTVTFLICDESHLTANSYDRFYQSTARSKNLATLYASQNISGYYATLGSKDETDSLLGSLKTKIHHSNDDKITAEWFADTVGKNWDQRMGISGSAMGQGSTGFHSHQDLNWSVLPRELMLLPSGGPEHDYMVGSYITVAGRKWLAPEYQKKTYIKRIWNQEFGQ